MTRQRQRQIFLANTGTVIAQPDQLDTTLLDIQLQLARAGIERILHQLLDHGGGAFDDFAGRDLVGQTGIKKLYTRHEESV